MERMDEWMVTLETIRAYATSLPEVEEKPHFGRPGFRVGDKLFASVHLEEETPYAIVHIDPADAGTGHPSGLSKRTQAGSRLAP